MLLSTFIHQKSYEKIVHKIRRDWVTLIPSCIGFLSLFTVPVILYFFFGRLFPGLSPAGPAIPAIILAVSIYYLSIILFFYTYYTTYYQNLLVVTNDRLIFIQQISLFARTISELDLFKIQDISSEVKGFLPSIFHYGTIRVQTAGTVEKFIINKIHDPEKLRRTILDMAEQDRKFHEGIVK